MPKPQGDVRLGQLSSCSSFNILAFGGLFTPVLAKHSKSFSLIDCIAVGVDRMQRNFEPMQKQVEAMAALGVNRCDGAFKELEPIPQFKATAKLGEFLEGYFSQSF
jgi:hypothetical protein